MSKSDQELGLKQNKTFYENLYQVRNPFAHLIRTWISFDQQSKARINNEFLEPYLKSKLATSTENKISLLDFGCGWGAFLMKMPRSIRLYCYDLSSCATGSIIKASKYLGYHIESASFENDEIIEPRNLDVIVCSHVLEHVEDDSRMLTVFHLALNKNGLLLVNVPINEIWDDPKHLRAYDKEGLISLLQANGFDIIDVLEADKWTGYLLEIEFQSKWPSVLSRTYCKVIRALLAILPASIMYWSESLFFRSRENNQLLSVSKKTVE